jgi:hypothetical protein
MDRKLAEHLVDQLIVSRQEMQQCILKASMDKSSVIERIAGLATVDEGQLAQTLAQFLGHEYVAGSSIHAQPYALKLVSREQAERHHVLPYDIDTDGKVVTVVISDPYSARQVIEAIKSATGKSVTIKIAAHSKLQREIFRHYGGKQNDATFSAAIKAGLNTASTPLPAGPRPLDKHLTREVEVPEEESPLPDKAGGADDFDFDEFDLGLAPPAAASFGEPMMFDSMPVQNATSERVAAKVDPKSPVPAAAKVAVGKREAPASAVEAASPSSSSPRKEAPLAAANAPENGSGISGALDEFDAFLDEKHAESSGFGLSNWGKGAGRSGFASPPGFSLEDSDSSALSRHQKPSSDGFDLFDDPAPAKTEEPEMTLREIVEQNRRTILRLEREIEHQRNVLQTLSDLLVEARVLSRRQLKERLMALRKK